MSEFSCSFHGIFPLLLCQFSRTTIINIRFRYFVCLVDVCLTYALMCYCDCKVQNVKGVAFFCNTFSALFRLFWKNLWFQPLYFMSRNISYLIQQFPASCLSCQPPTCCVIFSHHKTLYYIRGWVSTCMFSVSLINYSEI